MMSCLLDDVNFSIVSSLAEVKSLNLVGQMTYVNAGSDVDAVAASSEATIERFLYNCVSPITETGRVSIAAIATKNLADKGLKLIGFSFASTFNAINLGPRHRLWNAMLVSNLVVLPQYSSFELGVGRGLLDIVAAATQRVVEMRETPLTPIVALKTEASVMLFKYLGWSKQLYPRSTSYVEGVTRWVMPDDAEVEWVSKGNYYDAGR